MAQAIVTVLILLIFVAYAVFFSLWNATTIGVTGFYFPYLYPEPMGAQIPVFVLPLAGLLIGAIVMAIAVSAPWSSLKSKLIASEDQLDAARSRAKECEQKVESLRSRLHQLQAQKQPAPEQSSDAESTAEA